MYRNCDNIIAMKVLVVGAGASGCVAAINYKRNHPHDDVLIIEHLSSPLKKLLATGNGRCNLANSSIDISRYSNPKFVENILKEYDYEKFFDSISIKTKNIDDLVYPMSESAVSVKNALLNEIEKLGIKINLEEKLIDYKLEDKIIVQTNKNAYIVNKLFIATSLCSSSKLGSDGSIISILNKHNYLIKEPLPGLCPIRTKENTKYVDGIRTKCEVKLSQNNELIHREKGEVLFKKDGLSGIVIFNIASLIARSDKNANKISLDLLPDFSIEEIENYRKSHTFNGFLQAFFNPKLSQYLLARFKDENALIKAIKNLEFTFKDFYGFDFSQVSVGGVSLGMVNPSLESKKEKGVFLLGEILDIDGPCGGYNLTWAFASAIHATN